MAMEPLGSLMSVQMQNITPVETVKPVVPEGTDAAAHEIGAQLDATTVGVASVQEKGDGTDTAGQQAQAQACRYRLLLHNSTSRFSQSWLCFSS